MTLTRSDFLKAMAGLPVLGSLPARAQGQAQPFRIGIVEDLSGTYSGNGGPNTVLATRMAVEDFGGSVLGRPIEVVAVDHQTKPDLGSSLARQLVDQRGASALMLGGSSAVGLAVQNFARERKVSTLVTGNYAASFSGRACSPYATQWAVSTGELAGAIAEGVVKAGGNKWFLLVVDYAFGHDLANDATRAVQAVGGNVVGQVRHPLATADMSAPLLQARASGANVVALANAGPDLVNSVKQAKEYGIRNVTAMLVFVNNVVAMGLDTAQGLRFAVNWYWDLNDATRGFARRMMARNGNVVPDMGHVMGYISTLHYLQAVAKVGSDDAASVNRAMRDLPFTDGMLSNPRIQVNGRVVSDLYLAEVKRPAESRSAADLYRIVETIPGDKLFLPAERSGCVLQTT
ncbi:ABC transporter substrate-binding protein [Paracraurococcus ruber]|uniref:Branched-chain amino acid ABC transporter substrate-binding protein n=1 Tax=Paracraurococcus ruber TaxID=77675 RepID=A0ABS1CRX2_9PROT|nr:ABC transporter substrate-binding protein [Paracraurococcus ruber]MBK1657210.1 branched-chain amino acid ABC transporter substrate-binding protein [Paracraurococcus ruber]TDG32560.1 ABC transporter substrate-binding protein [Paracraurococcus ruber]